MVIFKKKCVISAESRQFSLKKFRRQFNLLPLQGSHRLEKYLNIQECLEKSLKIKLELKST